MREPTPPPDFREGESPRRDATPSRLRTAAGTVPPPRGRRHAADDIIESGEIVERRSLVVRSQKLQTVDWNEGPTEVATPSLPVPTPRRDFRIPMLIASIGFGAIAITMTIRAKPTPDAGAIAALRTEANRIATTLDGDAHGALVHAQGIATFNVMRRAIDTDASTLADMARDSDVDFALEPGEVLEIHQVADAHRALLLRLPADAQPLDPPPAGHARIEADDGRAVVVGTAVIANNRSKLAGEVVIAKTVDLAEATKQIAVHASGAALVGLAEPIALGAPGDAANVTIPIATKTPTDGTLALAATVPQPAAGSWLAWLCMFLAAGLFAAFVVITVRARRG